MACVFSVGQVELPCEVSGGGAWILDWVSQLWSSPMDDEKECEEKSRRLESITQRQKYDGVKRVWL